MKAVLAAFLLAACSGQSSPLEVGSAAPEPPGTVPVPLHATVSPTGDSLLVSDLVVDLAPGGTRVAALWIVAAGESAFEVIVAQVDTTAAVLRAKPLHYRRGGLVLADLLGTVLSEADVVLVSSFRFAEAGPSFRWQLPIEGKAPGKALLHVFWQRADGEPLGRALIEVRVR